ncbi:MAG: acyltransferase [Rhizobiaceae bacterium]
MKSRPEILKTADRVVLLDALRLLAALSVVAFHYLYRGAAADGYLAVTYPEAAPMARFLYLGVNLFFLISGFVITWSAEGRSWTDFAIARFARLYPGHVAAMSVTFTVCLLAAHPAFPVNSTGYLANLTMAAPLFGQPFMDGVYWTILLEIIFYFWVALLILSGLFERGLVAIVAVWLALSMANEFVIESGALRLVFLTEYAGYFAGGMLARHMMVHGRQSETVLMAIAAFLVSSNTMHVSRDWMLGHYGEAAGNGELLVANLLVHGLFFGALWLDRFARPSKWLLLAGALTYPLYLLHQNIGYILIGALAPALGRHVALAMALGAAIALSWLIVRFVEQPLAAPLKAALRRIISPFEKSAAA